MSQGTELGAVLVVGGSGYLGSNLVKQLQSEPSCSSIHVLSRNPKDNRYPGVEYHAGDIADDERVSTLLGEIKPRVIFHTASPDYAAPAKLLWHCNVDGTRVLLKCAAENPNVRAFVYTSSDAVVVSSSVRLTEETAQIHTATSPVNNYLRTKSIADAEVRAANMPQTLSTVALRVPAMWGDRDPKTTGALFHVLKNKQQNMQVGKDTALFEFCYIEKACEAHILAAKALLEDPQSAERQEKGKVDGEAFFISDDASIPWFAFARKVFAYAGHPVAEKDIKVVPYWLAMWFTIAGEWAYWIFTFGTKTPVARRQGIEHLGGGSHWDISKAKTRLGYVPLADVDGRLKEVVEAEAKRQGV